MHVVWGTLNREGMLDKRSAERVANFLRKYAASKQIFLKAVHVNCEHVHVLVELPTSKTIEQVVQLLKGASSHWIGEQKLAPGKFYWSRGYGVFSVSHSHLERVCKYITNQEEHHRRRGFSEEYELFVKRHGLEWKENR